MEIQEAHVEWAVVHRLGLLLEQSARGEYGTTHALALFETITAWVRQRVGRYKGFEEFPEALTFLKKPTQAAPWNISAGALIGQTRAKPFNGMRVGLQFDLADPNLPMWFFLVWLRNAMAHGDHNDIHPIHSKMPCGGSKHVLTGFRFMNGGGMADLDAETMRQIGAELVHVFCRAYGGTYYEQDVQRGVLEPRKAA